MTWTIHTGDALAVLRTLPTDSVHCVVTSPPYWGLRDYGVDGQIGLENTISGYVGRLVEVFRQVRRVLRPDGTMWLNLGDAYAGKTVGRRAQGPDITGRRAAAADARTRPGMSDGLKHKDLMGLPWRVAFALQEDGWYLRADVIWNKPNPMPESVHDRPTRSHEYLFLMTKSDSYHYDADAIREPLADPRRRGRAAGKNAMRGQALLRPRGNGLSPSRYANPLGRNKRSVWTIAPTPFRGAHFATYPTRLVEPCIRAGAPAGGTVLDPFSGAGTTGVVALREGRQYIGIELNSEYAEMSHARLAEVHSHGVQGLIQGVA
jgi:DNA modification methylase